MKTCSKCKINKNKTQFHKDSSENDGLKYNCKLCRKGCNLKYGYKGASTTAAWKLKNPERAQEIQQRYTQKNRQKYRDNANKWRIANPAKCRSQHAKRRADLLNRTPKWLTKQQHEDILNIYKTCPKGYHVDHIVPLRGETVSGLHVPWNLQHLEASENMSKKNKLE
jgi:hypothetical protein